MTTRQTEENGVKSCRPGSGWECFRAPLPVSTPTEPTGTEPGKATFCPNLGHCEPHSSSRQLGFQIQVTGNNNWLGAVPSWNFTE